MQIVRAVAVARTLPELRAMKRLLAIYKDQSRASRAARELKARGIADERISMLTADSASGQVFMASERSASAKTALAGAAVGTTGGLMAGALFGAGVLFVGPIALALAGAISGGLVGGLVGLGIPENEAEIRGRQIVDGAILVGVDVDPDRPDDERRATAALGATDFLHVTEVERTDDGEQDDSQRDDGS
jgi:uncharacterized membrane protein